MLTTPIRRGRSDALDVLRGSLALWVLFAHVIPWSVAYHGGTGAAPEALQAAAAGVEWFFQGAGETHPAVLLFIVLSGYCIHRAGLRGDGAGLGAYAVRRTFRIYPIYLLAIAAGVAGWAISASLAPTGTDIGGTTEIGDACLAAKASGIVTVWPDIHRCAFAGNAPLNTVMTEIWLYMAYPVLLLGVGARWGSRAMFAVIAAIFGLGLVAVALNTSLLHWWRSASLPGFLLYWWLGALATEPRAARLLARYAWAPALAFVALTVAMAAGETGVLLGEARKIALALLAAAGIAAIDRPMRFWAPVTAIGRSGYSLYAFHAPIAYTLLIAGAPWWAAILAPVAMGLVMFRLVEKPLTDFGARLASPRAAKDARPFAHDVPMG